MLMAANTKPKSESDKKFDDLLNKNCSWTYKSIKTIQCRTTEENDKNGPLLQIQTTNFEETAYNEGSQQKKSTYLLNGYDNIEEDTKLEPKKNKKLPTQSRSSKIVKLSSTRRSRSPREPKATSDRSMQSSTKMIRNKRNIFPVSYAEADSESSSDDGLVFISRGCDEGIVHGDSDDNDSDINEMPLEEISNVCTLENNYSDINEMPLEKNSNVCTLENNSSDINEMPLEEISNVCTLENNYKASDANDLDSSLENSLENCTEMNVCEASNYQNSTPQSYNVINETENIIEKAENKTHFQDQNDLLELLLNDDYEKINLKPNYSENRIPEKESDSQLSEILSSLSEWDGTKFEENKKKSRPSKEITNEDASNKNDLDSEIIRQYMTINTDVQSVCNELATPNDEDDVFDDFLNGNFDFEKYKSKINKNVSASTRKETKKNSFETEHLNETELDESPNIHSNCLKRSNEKVKKNNNRDSGNAKDTKGRRQKANNKTKSKNNDTASAITATKVKGNYSSNFDDNYTPSKKSNKEAGDENLVTNDYFKGNLFNSPARNPTPNKYKHKKNDSDDNSYDVKRNSKKKDALNVRSSRRIEKNYTSNFDEDFSPSVRHEKEESGNDKHQENEYSIKDDYFKENSFYSTEKNRTFNNNKQNRNNSENSTYNEKINSKNKDTSKERSPSKIKWNSILNLNDDYTPSLQSDNTEDRNDELERSEYSSLEDYSKKNSFRSPKKNRTLHKNIQKRNNSVESAHDVNMEENANIVNKPQLLDQKDLKLWFPNKSNDKQQLANSKTKGKENVTLRNITHDCSAKGVKKTPKTWEDLEADILNKEEQISRMPFFEGELFPDGEEFFNDGKSGHIGIKQNRSSFTRPVDKLETEKNKTDNKWSIVRSEPGNSADLACSKNRGEIAFDSPNANIIDRVLRRMQLCTAPVLTPDKVNQKSPFRREYSYSVQETKSVFLTTKKSLNEEKTGKPETARKNTKQKNYQLREKREIKAVIDSKGATIINQTSVKLNKIPRKKNKRISKSSESDNESMPESIEISDMESLTPESEAQLSLPQDLLVSDVVEPYNLRKRKYKDNVCSQNTVKKQSIMKANSTNKDHAIINHNYNHSKRNTASLIENPTNDDSIENFSLLNKRKRNNFMNGFANHADESDSENSYQNGSSSAGIISNHENRCLEKSNENLKIHNIGNEDLSSKTKAQLANGNASKPGQSLQNKAYDPKTPAKPNRQKRKLPKRDSKKEYERYLQKVFRKDITEDSNAEWGFHNGTSETPEKNLLGRVNKSYSSTEKPLTENSDEDLLSLSSDTDFEESSQRRASGLLDDVFN